MPDPEPEPPLGCISTLDHGCLAPSNYAARVDDLAQDYSGDIGFSNQWGFEAIGADRAYARLALQLGEDVQPGAGVTVGVIDTSIDTGHPVFEGKNVIQDPAFGAPDYSSSHGTRVASVIAARRGSRDIYAHGVAWGADLVMFPSGPIELPLTIPDSDVASAFRHVLEWRDGDRAIDFLNLSLGPNAKELVDNYSEQDLRTSWGGMIDVMAQADREDKTVFVIATGNVNGDPCLLGTDHCVGGVFDAVSPDYFAGLPARIEELRGHVVSVAAVDENGDIADFSNRCGLAAEWCLAAPGVNIRTAFSYPQIFLGPIPIIFLRGTEFPSGTSYAAPMVTGGLAVMKHLFRDQLSNTDLVARLLETANDEGVYADSAVYGHGLMDLGAATSPVGALMIPPPPSNPAPPMADPDPPLGCISTRDHGCLAPSEYDARVDMLAQGYSGDIGFIEQWGFETIGADRAYAHLALQLGEDVQPGAGVTVGVIDGGIDTDHPVFEGQSVIEDFSAFSLPDEYEIDGQTFSRPSDLEIQDETGDEFSHGTAVASVIAARRAPAPGLTDPNDAHGVAWGADLVMFPTLTGFTDGLLPFSISDGVFAGGLRHVLAWRDGDRAIDFLNLSFGPPDQIIDDYTEQDLRTSLGETIEAMAQADREDKTVFVFSASNGSDESVGPWAGLPARIEELRGHVISTVAVGQDGGIASFSNRCGLAAEWCLAAPGVVVQVAYFGPHQGEPGVRLTNSFYSGTSFAAPMVTGGLAVMKHLFRDQLSNTELVARLLETANDEGIYADSAVYGQGLMDLDAATSPVSALMMAAGGTVGGGVGLGMSQLSLGSALGDGLTRSVAGREIAAFDALGAPFWFRLGDMASRAPRPWMTTRLNDFMAPDPRRFGVEGRWGTFAESGSDASGWRIGLLETPAGVESGHFALAERALTFSVAGRGGLTATAFSTEGVAGQSPASGAVLTWRPFGLPVGMRAAWFAERETLLGSASEGAFGDLSTGTALVGLEGSMDIGSWRLDADAEVGAVSPRSRAGFVTDVSALTTSAFALGASRSFADGGILRLSVSQPLRVEDGRASLTVPVGRTKGSDVVRRSLSADLTPTGRQIDISAQWRRPLASGGEVRLGAVWTHEPGHRAAAPADLTVLAGWRAAF